MDKKAKEKGVMFDPLTISHDACINRIIYQDGKVVHTSYTCKICNNLKYGVIGNEHYLNEDLNVLNFERIKWGGVRHGALIYTLFDLEQRKWGMVLSGS